MEGVTVTDLRQIKHPQGDVYHAMKRSDIGFENFGEAYFSTINKGDIKGWKKHTKMVLNLIVPVGAIKFVIYDEEKKDFFEIELSQNYYKRLTIKAGLCVSFRGISDFNMLLNVASLEHDPKEAINIELNEIVYDWK